MGAATLVYKDDIFGDKAQTTAPCSLYYRQVLVQQCEKGMVKYKKEPISNKNIWYHLELPANDADFKSSQAYVNGECEKAITDLYGNFSPLSSPIFTQALLSSFADQYKVTFPTQYKAILCFLNKGGSFKDKRVKKNCGIVTRSTSSAFWCISGIRFFSFGGKCAMSPHIMVMEVAACLSSLEYMYLEQTFFASRRLWTSMIQLQWNWSILCDTWNLLFVLSTIHKS